MQTNYIAIILLSILNCIIGAAWYSPALFGKIWMKIHGVFHLTKEEQIVRSKGMWKLILAEFFATLIINYFLYIAVVEASSIQFAYGMVFLLWFGFILPTITSSVLWGNDEKRFMLKKIAISATSRLVLLLISATVFYLWR
jgi:hypothetical protein